MARRRKQVLTRGERVVEFIRRYLRVPEGVHVGKALEPAPFQVDFIKSVYDNPHGTRRAYLSTGRKNAKTTGVGALLMAHLIGPEASQNSQIVSGAMSRDQAAIVFDLCRKMIDLNPDLRRVVRVVPSGKRLYGLPMNVEYRALAADGTTAHGLSPKLAILDEVGQIKGTRGKAVDFVDAITTAQGAHDSPLLFAISTQAPTDADLFSMWLDDAARSSDPRIVSRVYTAPEGCDLLDRAAWRAANPALGMFRSEGDVAEQADRALRMPSEEATFRVLTLNQRVNPHNPFVSRNVWLANGEAPDPDAFRLGEVYGGLDLSETTDLTAFVLAAWWCGQWHVRVWFWMAEGLVQERARADRVPYDVWAREGWLQTTPGVTVNYGHVAQRIADECDGLDVRAIAFDRYRMQLFRVHMERLGIDLPLIEFGQGYRSMSPAVQALEEALLEEKVRHGNHPILTMCAANAVEIRDPAGNRKLDKARSTGRIDGMVALVQAVGSMPLAGAPPEGSVYEGRGLLML